MAVHSGGEAASGAGVCVGGCDAGGRGAGDVVGRAVAVAARRRRMKRESIFLISEIIVAVGKVPGDGDLGVVRLGVDIRLTQWFKAMYRSFEALHRSLERREEQNAEKAKPPDERLKIEQQRSHQERK